MLNVGKLFDYETTLVAYFSLGCVSIASEESPLKKGWHVAHSARASHTLMRLWSVY